MRKTRYFVIFIAVLLLRVATAQGQYVLLPPLSEDTISLPKWEPHLQVGMGFLGSANGDNRLFNSVAPSLTYRPNKKWTVNGGFRFTSDMGLNPHFSLSKPEKNLAPYKRNGGTGLASAHLEAVYRAGENVWLAASVYHIGGSYAPLYGFANGDVLPVSATAISAAAAFRFNEESFLQLSFTVLRDHDGTLPYMYHDTWMHGGLGHWGMFASPTDYYRMAIPFNPYYMGGIY